MHFILFLHCVRMSALPKPNSIKNAVIRQTSFYSFMETFDYWPRRDEIWRNFSVKSNSHTLDWCLDHWKNNGAWFDINGNKLEGPPYTGGEVLMCTKCFRDGT